MRDDGPVPLRAPTAAVLTVHFLLEVGALVGFAVGGAAVGSGVSAVVLAVLLLLAAAVMRHDRLTRSRVSGSVRPRAPVGCGSDHGRWTGRPRRRAATPRPRRSPPAVVRPPGSVPSGDASRCGNASGHLRRADRPALAGAGEQVAHGGLDPGVQI